MSMLVVPVYDMKGKKSGEMKIDPAILGGRIRPTLIKQAVVAYLDHQRQHSARTKRRSDVVGSTKKLYRQKGTGNARAGAIRTPVRRGGGRTFGKRGPRSTKDFSRKMRRLARNSAILAKIEAQEVIIVDKLTFAEAKTKTFVSLLAALKVERGCLLAMHQADKNIYLSSRNLPKTEVRLVQDLHAFDVLLRQKLIFTKPAFERLIADPVTFKGKEEEVA